MFLNSLLPHDVMTLWYSLNYATQLAFEYENSGTISRHSYTTVTSLLLTFDVNPIQALRKQICNRQTVPCKLIFSNSFEIQFWPQKTWISLQPEISQNNHASSKIWLESDLKRKHENVTLIAGKILASWCRFFCFQKIHIIRLLRVQECIVLITEIYKCNWKIEVKILIDIIRGFNLSNSGTIGIESMLMWGFTLLSFSLVN